MSDPPAAITILKAWMPPGRRVSGSRVAPSRLTGRRLANRCSKIADPDLGSAGRPDHRARCENSPLPEMSD